MAFVYRQQSFMSFILLNQLLYYDNGINTESHIWQSTLDETNDGPALLKVLRLKSISPC